ncbi:MAG: hypothetical protein R2795_22105 [Saprospiraceae bacterium]
MEDNFTRGIRDILNNPPNYPFDESAWQRLENKLVLRRSRGWGTLLSGVLLAISLVCWWRISHQVDRLQAMLMTVEQTANEKAVDTHIIYRTIIVTDTVFQFYPAKNNASYQEPENSLPSNATHIKGGSRSFAASWDKHLAKQNWLNATDLYSFSSIRFRDNLVPHKAIDAEEQSDINSLTSENKLILLPTLSYAVTRKEGILPTTPFLQDWQAAFRHRNRAVSTIENRWSIYGHVSAMLPLSYQQEDAFYYALQVGGEYKINNGISWVLGINRINGNGKIETDNEAPLEGYPSIDFDNPDDLLHEINAQVGYWQMPFGVKWSLKSHNRWTPAVGAGVLTQLDRSTTLGYEINTSSGGKYEKVLQIPNNSRWQIGSWWIEAGIQHPVGKQWQLQLFAATQGGFRKGAYFYDNPLLGQLGIGMKYRFVHH